MLHIPRLWLDIAIYSLLRQGILCSANKVENDTKVEKLKFHVSIYLDYCVTITIVVTYEYRRGDANLMLNFNPICVYYK